VIRFTEIRAARLACLGLLVVVAGGTLIAAAPAGSQELGMTSRALPPKPARGRGEKCVADTDWMRRNHMTVLNHQRNDTVHYGIRTERFSLKGCIDCHAVKGTDSKPVTIASDKHFCRTCHDYAAVRVDCFECHASQPETKSTTTGKAVPERPPGTDVASLARYLRNVGQ
jgi:predicted CXXCH cytochrome family protein